MSISLRRVNPEDVSGARAPVIDPQTLSGARLIVDDVRTRGRAGVLDHAHRLGDLSPGQPPVVERAELLAALDALDPEDRRVLERAAARITDFARAQRGTLTDLSLSPRELPGVRVGHTVRAVDRAGCYAPGGRFPLPSSVLMTVCTARAAGVGEVWLASPRPAPGTLAAAAIAGCDGVLRIGGAQAIAAMAFGAPGLVPRCDVVCGPGNRWVTAAKHLVGVEARIDLLAGPSEVLIIADAGHLAASPADHTLVHTHAADIAADMLAQCEHDADASALLVIIGSVNHAHALLDRVEHELAAQLATLPTRDTATLALRNSFAVITASIDEAIRVADAIAPEHLEVSAHNADRARAIAAGLRHYGAVFIGRGSAEVIGDYGVGPNHTLPTGGTARHSAGLSVFSFLRVQPFVEATDAAPGGSCVGLYRDTARLARLEGLEGHARAAERRLHAPG